MRVVARRGGRGSALVAWGLLLGCLVDNPIYGDAAATSGADPATAAPDPGTGTTRFDDTGVLSLDTSPPPPLTTEPLDTFGDSAADFATGPETTGPPSLEDCDLYTLDSCPAGTACKPVQLRPGDIESWAAWCVPLLDDPGLEGDACRSSPDGDDTCGEGLVCWNGTCALLCQGSPRAPGCPDPQYTCALQAGGFFGLCQIGCDVLIQDCEDGFACHLAATAVGLVDAVCVVDASGGEGEPGAACEAINECNPGGLCAAFESLPCPAGERFCCHALCDLGKPSPCPVPTACEPWPDMSPLVPELSHLGICQ